MLEKIESFAEKHELFPKSGLVLAAVSGGADSVCLLAVLLELSKKYGFTVAALHYNHQLRGEESDRDARFVEDLCREKNVPLYTGAGDVAAYARKSGCGIEEAARRLRYDFFHETAEKLKAERIATAHTAEDNIETVLLNLTRGAGANGLGGIPPRRGIVIRPMLTVSRDQVLDFLRERSLTYCEDATNAQPICGRNIVRHRVVPVLKQLNPRLAESVATTAALLREDEAYLSGLAESYIADHLVRETPGVVALDAAGLAALPAPVARRVVRSLAGRTATAKHVAAVLALCASEDVSARIALPGMTVFREYGRILFSRDGGGDTAAGFAPVTIQFPEDGGDTSAVIPELGLHITCRLTDFPEKIQNSFTTFLFKYDKICGKIVIRPRETGDKIDLYGRNGTKTLKKLFIEHRIPARKRPLIPVIADEIGVLGVLGLGFDKRAAGQSGDTAVEIFFEETAYET
jgi:tRNA(Ile)-lysidine synthase